MEQFDLFCLLLGRLILTILFAIFTVGIVSLGAVTIKYLFYRLKGIKNGLKEN